MKKIVVIGPESTGKSSLCEELAQHFDTLWCPEFAREYLLTNGKDYQYSDLLTIAKGQLAMEEEYESSVDRLHSQNNNNPSLLFIDTDMYVMKVWCEFVFGKCHAWILDQVVKKKYDLYLLCNIDLPWVQDELREYPDLESRQRLYHIYKDIMINQSTPWIDISGDYEERRLTAIAAVEQLLKQ